MCIYIHTINFSLIEGIERDIVDKKRRVPRFLRNHCVKSIGVSHGKSETFFLLKATEN